MLCEGKEGCERAAIHQSRVYQKKRVLDSCCMAERAVFLHHQGFLDRRKHCYNDVATPNRDEPVPKRRLMSSEDMQSKKG